MARGPYAEGDCNPTLGDVVPNPIEVDTDRGRRLPPARHLSVTTVEQHLQLHQDHRKDGAKQRRPSGRHGSGGCADDHQPGDAIRAEPGSQQNPCQIRRNIPQIGMRDPVFGGSTSTHAGRLCHLT